MAAKMAKVISWWSGLPCRTAVWVMMADACGSRRGNIPCQFPELALSRAQFFYFYMAGKRLQVI